MPRILVVEDDAAIAKVLIDNLEFEGYEVLALKCSKLHRKSQTEIKCQLCMTRSSR